MKATTLIAMMKQEEYQCLTCKEFADIVESFDVLEDDTIQVGDDLSWLGEMFAPSKVTYNGEEIKK